MRNLEVRHTSLVGSSFPEYDWTVLSQFPCLKLLSTPYFQVCIFDPVLSYIIKRIYSIKAQDNKNMTIIDLEYNALIQLLQCNQAKLPIKKTNFSIHANNSIFIIVTEYCDSCQFI